MKTQVIRVGFVKMQITKIGKSTKVSFMSSGRVFSAIDRDREKAIHQAIDLLRARKAQFAPRD